MWHKSCPGDIDPYGHIWGIGNCCRHIRAETMWVRRTNYEEVICIIFVSTVCTISNISNVYNVSRTIIITYILLDICYCCVYNMVIANIANANRITGTIIAHI